MAGNLGLLFVDPVSHVGWKSKSTLKTHYGLRPELNVSRYALGMHLGRLLSGKTTST